MPTYLKWLFSFVEIVNMNIKVNDKVVEVFAGACVKDVLRKFSGAEWRRVKSGKKTVFDRHGHEVGLDGELSGGEELFIKSSERVESKP
jgi:hypothetical protein